jgi:hypothetical protein
MAARAAATVEAVDQAKIGGARQHVLALLNRRSWIVIMSAEGSSSCTATARPIDESVGQAAETAATTRRMARSLRASSCFGSGARVRQHAIVSIQRTCWLPRVLPRAAAAGTARDQRYVWAMARGHQWHG